MNGWENFKVECGWDVLCGLSLFAFFMIVPAVASFIVNLF